jgi:hypothetical protein
MNEPEDFFEEIIGEEEAYDEMDATDDEDEMTTRSLSRCAPPSCRRTTCWRS